MTHSNTQARLQELVDDLHEGRERHERARTYLRIRLIASQIRTQVPQARALILDPPDGFDEWLNGHPEERDWSEVLETESGFRAVTGVLLTDGTVAALPRPVALEGEWREFAQRVEDVLPDEALAESLKTIGWRVTLTGSEDEDAHDRDLIENEQSTGHSSYVGHRISLVRSVLCFLPVAQDLVEAGAPILTSVGSVGDLPHNATEDDIENFQERVTKQAALSDWATRCTIHKQLARLILSENPDAESLLIGHSKRHAPNADGMCQATPAGIVEKGTTQWFGDAEEQDGTTFYWGLGDEGGLSDHVHAGLASTAHDVFGTQVLVPNGMRLITAWGTELVDLRSLPLDNNLIESVANEQFPGRL